MKYLVILRVGYEPDNNTPSEEIWAKITEFKDEDEKNRAEEVYLEETAENSIGAIVQFFPLKDLDEDWEKVGEVW